MIYDLIALGETMVSLSPGREENLESAKTLAVDHAGAESNTCVGLARLGFKVAWISRLGLDPFGDRILEALQHEGIDTNWVIRVNDRSTGLMVKDPQGRRVLYYRTGSAASGLSPDDLDGVPVAHARAVLVTGVTALIGARPQAAAIALLRQAKGLRVVDPNLRPGLWGSNRRAELVLPLLKCSDLVLGGEKELAELIGPSEPQELGRQCSACGPGEIVVRSSDRVGVYRRDEPWCEIEFSVLETADPVGAGDAFNAGYIASRLRGSAPEPSLRFALRCGKAVATSLGDTTGFPRSFSDAN
jgi:2-dehydro-3-deoxygluconokinase